MQSIIIIIFKPIIFVVCHYRWAISFIIFLLEEEIRIRGENLAQRFHFTKFLCTQTSGPPRKKKKSYLRNLRNLTLVGIRNLF